MISERLAISRFVLFIALIDSMQIMLHGIKYLYCCSRSFLVYLFLRIAGVSYGRFIATRCRLICRCILGTVGDR